MIDDAGVRAEKLDQFAARLLGVAKQGEQLFAPVDVLLAMLSASVNYALRNFPEPEIVALLRSSADKLEAAAVPRGPAN